MIILSRDEAPRKKGYYIITVAATEAESVRRESLEALFPGLFEEPLEVTVSEEALFRRNLRPGEHIEADDLAELLRADELVKAKDAALRFLNYKMRTRAEVEAKLRESGFSPEVTAATVKAVETYGFLDDTGYAKVYSKERIRQRGTRIIEHELAQKGIDKEIARDLLEDLKDAEYDAALDACLKKIRSLSGRGLEEAKIREKVYRFLISRGYDYDLIKKVYNVSLEQTNED